MHKAAQLVSMGFLLVAILACTVADSSNQRREQKSPAKVLVFSKTEGFRHKSIPDGVAAFKHFAANDSSLAVTATEDAGQISTTNLRNYGAVVFLNTTGNVLDQKQQAALKQFIQKGGGFMGVHAATDTEFNWPWYGRMIGAYFDDHPAIQEAKLHVLSKNHPSTKHLPDLWTRTDEWYNFRDIQPYINPLINLDESSYEGGKNGKNHPVAWYHEFEGGHVFYTAGGHTSESFDNELFRQHLKGGLRYLLDK